MKRVFTLLAILFALIIQSTAQDNNKATALLVIDIQDFYFSEGDVPLVRPEAAAQNAFYLIDHFRKKDMPVIYIRHNYQPGGDISKIVEPLANEKVISKSEVNSFKGTDLDEYLKSIDITKLVICGMQTQMCVEAATRAGYDMGYKCTLVEDACATHDLKYNNKIIKAEDVHLSTLASLKSYAKIVTTKDFLK